MLFATSGFHYWHYGDGYDAQTANRQKGDADLFALRHLIPAAFRALFRMVFLSLLFAVVAGGIYLVLYALPQAFEGLCPGCLVEQEK